MKERIEKSFKKAIAFLDKRQLSSGEFSTTRAEKIDMKNFSYIKSVFFTKFVLHCLSRLKDVFNVNGIVLKATKFLLNENEEGFWRFFGKGTHLPLDLDDTCCALFALFENGVEFKYRTVASYLLNYRDDRCFFYIWIFPKIHREFKNDVDWVINANALFFFT